MAAANIYPLPARKRHSHPRPIKTTYVVKRGVRTTSSCSTLNATLNALKHCLRGEAESAQVADPKGRLVTSVTPTPVGFTVTVHRKRGLE